MIWAGTSSSVGARMNKSVATSSLTPLTFAFNSESQQRLLDFKPEILKPKIFNVIEADSNDFYHPGHLSYLPL